MGGCVYSIMALLSKTKESLLDGLYFNVKNPSCFKGPYVLFQAAVKINPNITLKDVHSFLRKNRTYTLHRQSRKKFKRRQILSPKPSVILASDIAEMRPLAKYNNGINYILVFVDAFSRYAQVIPSKRKDASSMLSAFKSIFDKDVNPYKNVSRVHVDRGGEYYNSKLQAYLKEKGIKLYSVHSQETKSAIAERFIRTLKSLIFKYMSAHNTRKYIDVLPKIVESYNQTQHRSLKGLAPIEAHQMTRPCQYNALFRKMHYIRQGNDRKCITSLLDVGDNVRLTGAWRNDKISKGFKIQNTEEIFTVSSVNTDHYPLTYRVKDLNNEAVQGVFYREELIPVTLPDYFPVIVKKKRVLRGKKQLYVSWVGYPKSNDTWIDEGDIVTCSR